MNKKWKVFLSFGALITLIGLGIFFTVGENKNQNIADENGSGEVAGATSNTRTDYLARLSRHLNDSNMVLYGSNQSAETKEQTDLFGEVIKEIDYVDCDAAVNSSNPDECIGQNITVYPTWVYQGEKFEGVQTLSELAKISNFEQ